MPRRSKSASTAADRSIKVNDAAKGIDSAPGPRLEAEDAGRGIDRGESTGALLTFLRGRQIELDQLESQGSHPREYQEQLRQAWDRAWRVYQLTCPEPGPPPYPTVATKLEALGAIYDLLRWVEDKVASPATLVKESQGGTEHGERVASGQLAKKAKRSTERGEGRVKLIAALTRHHRYADGSCLNLEPIGNNDLAKVAEVSRSTASAFFKTEFQGYTQYKILCRDSGKLVGAIKLLNNEFSPHHLYGRRPPGEDDRTDEGDG